VEPHPLQHESLRETGVYRVWPARHEADGRLTRLKGGEAYYVVQPDHHESDLTPASAEDRARVAALVPVQYENERRPVAAALVESSQTQDLWWWFMVGVILLLCGEVWMTRRMVKGRETAA
jgi:hypothetical protein